MRLRGLLPLFAPFSIAQFFLNDANRLVSRRGAEVLNSPVLKEQVEQAISRHRLGNCLGPVVVTFQSQ